MRVTVLSVLVLALLLVAGVEAAQDGSLRAKLNRLGAGAAAAAPRPLFECNTKSSSGVWSICSGFCVQKAASEASPISGLEKGTCVAAKPAFDPSVEVARRPYKCSKSCAAGQCCMPPEFVKVNAITNEGVCKACPASATPTLPAGWRKTSSCFREGRGMFACGSECCDWRDEDKFCLTSQSNPSKRSCVFLDSKTYVSNQPLVFAKYNRDEQTLESFSMPTAWKLGSQCGAGASACGTECCSRDQRMVCLAAWANPMQRKCVKDGKRDAVNCIPMLTNKGSNQLPYCSTA